MFESQVRFIKNLLYTGPTGNLLQFQSISVFILYKTYRSKLKHQ